MGRTNTPHGDPQNAVPVLPVSPGRRKPGEQVYRFSTATIARWTRILKWSIPGLIVPGVLVLAVNWLIGSVFFDADAGSSIGLIIGAAIVTAGFILPLLGAAIFGGESLVRGGGVVGGLLVVGMLTTAVGSALEHEDWRFWGIVIIVAGAVGFFILGFIRRVPMWIGGVFRIRRAEVSDGILPGESSPGVLRVDRFKTDRPDKRRE